MIWSKAVDHKFPSIRQHLDEYRKYVDDYGMPKRHETPFFKCTKHQLAVRKIESIGMTKGAQGASGHHLDFRLEASVQAPQLPSGFGSETLCNRHSIFRTADSTRA
ncbi:hypothetical protein BG004_004134 [Podila humilis]|nr:hypothetical protein BG004_004134 [Podila humilis]